MSKGNLEGAIEKAASEFSKVIIAAVKSATLQELIALQAGAGAQKAKRKPGRPRGLKVAKKKAKKVAKKAAAAPAKKKRVVKNYPKCAYPGCEKNRFPRGKGYCGDHWRLSLAGKLKGEKK